MVAETSREAFAELSPARLSATKRRILAALLHRPDTARGVAARVGISEHEGTRRCSDLLAVGVLEIIGLTTNPDTGKRARILAPRAELARAVLHVTSVRPAPGGDSQPVAGIPTAPASLSSRPGLSLPAFAPVVTPRASPVSPRGEE